MEIARYIFDKNIDILPTFNDGFIYEYTDIDNGDGTATRTITSDNLPSSISFNGKTGLISVEYLDTSNVTDMSFMFYNCTSLTSIDVSNWDTSNVTNMGAMFQYCNKLTSLNIPNMKFDKLTTITNFLQNSGIKQLNFSRNTLPEISMADFMNDATSLNVIKCENRNNIAKVISHLPVRTVENPGKIITQVPMSQFTELEIQALADKNWAISNEELVVVAKYKFAKDIYRSMIPVFNEEFTNYFVDDEYLDTEDLTGMYKSLPNKSNGASGEADYTITADNIVTRTISVLVDDVKPYNIRFGSHVVNVSSTTKDRHKSGSIIEILDLNISTNYNATLMFNCCVNMINCNINGLNTDAASSMYGMFAGCCKLTTLDIDHLNVIKVQNFEAMFSNCESLTSLDLSNFDTSEVTNMSYMFYGCYNLTSLDLSSFDTSQVNYMNCMFYDCESLTSLDLSNFDTSKVTDMNCMFFGCYELISLDLSSFDTSQVIDMNCMFYECYNLASLDLSNFDTSKVTDMSYAFTACVSLASIDVSNWKTSNVTATYAMFDGCSSLTSLDLSGWNTSNMINMNSMFSGCTSLISLDLSNWVLNDADIGYMCSRCTRLTTMKLNNWNFNKPNWLSSTFNSCTNLNLIYMKNSNVKSVNNIISLLPTRTTDSPGTIDITGIDDINQVNITTAESNFWNVTLEDSEEPVGNTICVYKFDKTINENLIPTFNEDYINYNVVDESSDNNQIISRSIYGLELPTKISFEGQTSLIESNYLNTSNMTSAYNLFYNCTNLTYVDLRGSDFSKIETIERMFAYCSNLLTIDGLNDIDISNVNNMGGVFTDCSKIPELNVSNWNVSKVTNFGAAFRRCSELTNIDVSKWNTSSGVIMSGIFTNCTGLIELDLSNWTVANSDTVSQMFYGCSNLVTLKLFKALPESSTTTLLFGKNNLLNKIQIDYLDTYTINTIISLIPTRTANNQGTLIVPKIDDSINTAAASAKYWIAMADPTNIRLINLGNIIISNLYVGDIEVEKVYIGDIVIYENKQAVNDKELLYNEVTGTLFIIKKNAISYDVDNQVLNIDGDILRLEYSEDSLNIGGDT